MTHVEQQAWFEELSEYVKSYVKGHDDRVARKEVLNATAEHFNILVSEAKYGMTYAWATGKVKFDQNTLDFVTI